MLERLLGRATTWLLRHRLLVLGLWLLALPALVFGYLRVNERLKSIVGSNDAAQSSVVSDRLARDFSGRSQFLTVVTFHHEKELSHAPAYAASMTQVLSGLRGHRCVRQLTTLADVPLPSLFVSPCGRTQIAALELAVPVNAYTEAETCVVALRRAVREASAGLPLSDLEVLVTGTPAINLDIGLIVERDSHRAEALVIGFSLILLVWMFRSAAAALLPLITAALSVMSCLSLLWLLGGRMDISVFVSPLATMTGLALGLDYALLYVTRFQEELGAGRPPEAALETTARTAGKAILGSGALVMLGFAGLFVPPLGFARSVALAGVLIVFCTVVTTLTLLPVLVHLFRPALGWPRWGWFRRSHAAMDRFWERWGQRVLRRPLVPLLGALALVALCAPHLFGIRVKNPRHEIIPNEIESRRGVDRLIEVSGESRIYPITVLVRLADGGTWRDPARQAALARVVTELRQWPDVLAVETADQAMALSINVLGARLGYGFGEGFARRFVSDDFRTVSVDLYARKVDDRDLGRLVVRLRDRLPEALPRSAGFEVWVGGRPAMSWETLTELIGNLPVMIPLVVLTAFVVMALLFRSLLVPAKAVLLNVLSMSTTYGILVLVFQKGYGLSFFGYHGPPPEALSLATPVVMFCVLFGVSMDYEVFLVSRIQEAWRRAGGNGGRDRGVEARARHLEAIHTGLARTGGIITNAALLMVVTFAAFLTGTLLPMKEMGFALALAVLLDATLVRMILVPVMLRLLGPLTWWWPRPAPAGEAPAAAPALSATDGAGPAPTATPPRS